jgi:c(7)-type cytochrome triheme protein
MKILFTFLLPSLLLLTLSTLYGQKGRGALKIPDEIKTPSHIGEIIFPHRAHFEEFDVECASCHHRIKTSSLKIPHRFSTRENWKDCTFCHDSDKSGKNLYSCKSCHNKLEKNYLKQVLSYKVVVHKSCEECHEMGKGVEASKSCKFCHTGPKLGYK